MGTLNGREWLDYSSLVELMRCPRAFQWRCEKHLALPPNIKMRRGSGIHKALSIYYSSTSNDRAKKALDTYLQTFSAEEMNEPTLKKEIDNGVLALLKYFKRWERETYTTISTEIGFAFDAKEFTYVGVIDRFVDTRQFGRMPLETKSTGSPYNWGLRTKPNLQIEGYMIGIYALTGELPLGGILDVIPVGSRCDKIEPERYIGMRTKDELDIWLINVQSWWHNLCSYREHKFFPQNTEECIPLVGFQCDYIPLCQKYPKGVEGEMEPEGEFVYTPWTPYPDLQKGGINERNNC
jgi:hypothetical protein